MSVIFTHDQQCFFNFTLKCLLGLLLIPIQENDDLSLIKTTENPINVSRVFNPYLI